ncbi:hypothetical protein BDZ89DRAFT_1037892 [Hymenopellis radicata]|nr:hypothetical protein BDZ89DRAFT_1037892 [Hymenopellis radicata]
MDDYLPELILLCGAGAILALNFFTTPREEATRLEGLMFLRTTWLNNNDALYITLTLRMTVGGKDVYAMNDPAARTDDYDVRSPAIQILQPTRGSRVLWKPPTPKSDRFSWRVGELMCATSIPNCSSSQLVEEYPSQTEALHSAMTPSLDRFQHLTEVNAPPNHWESSELRFLIFESDSQLSDLHRILAQAKHTVKSIKQRVDDVTFVLNSAKKITHPLRSVPNEILCLIFAQCVDYDARARNSLYTDQAPWTLSYVCSRWRRLVLSFPFLWTRPCFDFTIYGPIGGVHRQMVYLMTLYIERSRALPLDITVQVMNDWIGHYALRHIIQATTARWKSAVLDLPLSEILLFKGCTFPLLESVKIQSRHPAIANGQDVDVFLSMPLLRSITITSESSLALYSALMPWSQIVEYDCEHHAFSVENLDVLRQMTSLRSLVAYPVVGLTSLEVAEPVVLPSLTHLVLSVAGATSPNEINLSGYLAFLRMPLLSNFILNYCEPDALCPVSSHPDFSSVKYLGVHLDMASSNAEDFVHFLSFMDGVEELELSGNIISVKLLQVLTPSEDGMLVLPRLRVLDIHNAVYSLASDDGPILPSPPSFHNMLLSRSRAHKRLIFTLEEFTASLVWRDENHEAVALRDEDSRRWEQVRAAISVVYLEPERDTEHSEADSDSDDSE